MSHTHLKLEGIAQCARIFFERESARGSDLPFVPLYPKNCCEVASAFVGLALERVLSHCHVQVAKAYNRQTDVWHLWVEAGDQVIDITAHQFDEYEDILVCGKPSPLEQAFPDIEYVSSVEVLRGLSRISPADAEEVLVRLVADFDAFTGA